MSDFDSLWGDDFELPKEKEKVKKVVEKIKKPKEVKAPVEKQVKSKSLSLDAKLEVIYNEVLRILGHQKDNVQVIKSEQELHDYITDCIKIGRIAIDTETNNSLDPVTCKLMGPCFYAPGKKQAYVPVNHVDRYTRERLPWQVTEEIICRELQRLLDAGTFIIMHNGKFDYQVIKCTCGICLPIMWDTMIGAKLLDENERSAGLKQQYIAKIDPTQEKYSIDELFKNIEYAIVDPDIFALYAATDSMMTDKLFEYQFNQFKNPDLSRVLNLYNTIELPLVQVIAEMELAGMSVDQEYAKNLSATFHEDLSIVDAEIEKSLAEIQPRIDAWRLTPEANFKPTKGKPAVINGIEYAYMNASGGPGDMPYWYEKKSLRQLSRNEVASLGLTATYGKSKNEQLETPINLASPTQLAILFYDVLGCPAVSKKSPRGTGEDELKAIAKELNLEFCNLLIKRRELVKLITTYVDVIPELANRWPDGRVRTHFNQYGAATGRLSSSDPINFQNIPSGDKRIRMLFCSPTEYIDVDEVDDYFDVPEYSEVCRNGNEWIFVEEINAGDCVELNDGTLFKVLEINKLNKAYRLKIENNV